MPDPAKHVGASVRYEVTLMSGPGRITLRGEEINLKGGEDIPVLVRITLMGILIVDRTVIGIIGGPFKGDSREFLNLQRFLSSGGVIGISRDLLL